MAVVVTRMTASVGSTIVASGTVSTRTSRLPCQARAFMWEEPPGGRWTQGSPGAARRETAAVSEVSAPASPPHDGDQRGARGLVAHDLGLHRALDLLQARDLLLERLRTRFEALHLALHPRELLLELEHPLDAGEV